MQFSHAGVQKDWGRTRGRERPEGHSGDGNKRLGGVWGGRLETKKNSYKIKKRKSKLSRVVRQGRIGSKGKVQKKRMDTLGSKRCKGMGGITNPSNQGIFWLVQRKTEVKEFGMGGEKCKGMERSSRLLGPLVCKTSGTREVPRTKRGKEKN